MDLIKNEVADVGAVGVTADDVRACFEIMLGRVPDQALVDYHLTFGFADRAALGRYIRGTTEFEALYLGVPLHVGDLSDEWKRKAVAASTRLAKLRSFGGRARGVLVDGDTGWYVVDPEDGEVSASLLNRGDYAPDELALAAGLIPEGGTALVVGTHIGALAIPLSRRCARLDAVEANPRTRELLALNLRLNGCDNVELFPFAASDRTEVIEFLLSRANSGGAKRRPLSGSHYFYDSPEIVQVEARAMDTLVGGRRYDLILMDCEGSEIFALRGMTGVLATCSFLAVEFLPHHIQNVGGTDADGFADAVEPYFSWLYIPASQKLVAKHNIRPALRDMFLRNEGHDTIIFADHVIAGWGET